MAWEQEEQTNKPVVLFCVVQLLYAEYGAGAKSRDALDTIITLILFLLYFESTWQAYRDRALRLLGQIEGQGAAGEVEAARARPEQEVIEEVLARVPKLLG